MVRFLLGCWDLRSRCVQELRGMVQSAGPFLFFPFTEVQPVSIVYSTSRGATHLQGAVALAGREDS